MEDGGDDNRTVLLLVVLEEGNHEAGGGKSRPIESVDQFRFIVSFLVTNFGAARLEVGTI